MEINMGSEVEKEFNSTMLRKKLQLKAKKVDTTSLRDLGRKLKTIRGDAFRKRYGNLLNLMEVEVQESAITALAQYYDPPLRCFTFQDFQLVPTVEEFEQILDLPMEGRVPYRHIEQHASIPTIASIMNLHSKELEERLVNKNRTKGLTRGYLEQYLHHLASKEDWDTFMDVLALTIYGVVLFPSVENFVDSVAINVFIASRNRLENPVTAVLADVYGTMHFCHERKGKKIICCLPVLFVWLITRVFKRPLDIKCPVEELLQCKPDAKGGNDWAQYFASLNEEGIKWRPSWQQKTNLIYHCGDYPNVPLIGTKCCINYNPILAQRQFGYPIKGSPTPGSLTPLTAYYDDGHVTEMLQRIRSAWGKIVRRDKDLRPESIEGRISYRQWLAGRVKEIKLPFKPISTCSANNEPQKDVETDEVKHLKVEMEKMKEKNLEMAKELQSMRHDYVDIRREKTELTRAYEEILRSQRSERDYTSRIKQDLAAANTELTMRAQERDAALEAERHWKHLYKEVKREKQEALKRLRDMQVRIGSMEQQMKDVVAACEAEINKDHWQLIDAEERHQIMMTQMETYIAEQESIAEHWRKCFSQLAALANGAIDDVPRMLSDAESMVQVFNFPEEIKTFISHCKWLVGEMKNLIISSKNF